MCMPRAVQPRAPIVWARSGCGGREARSVRPRRSFLLSGDGLCRRKERLPCEMRCGGEVGGEGAWAEGGCSGQWWWWCMSSTSAKGRCSVNERPCVAGGGAPGQGVTMASPAPLRRKNSALGDSVAAGCWGPGGRWLR